MPPCDICKDLDVTAITAQETCRLQDWDRMQSLAAGGCDGCVFFWNVIRSYSSASSPDTQFSWVNVGLRAARPMRRQIEIQALAVGGCRGCEDLLAAIKDRTRFEIDDGEDWDVCDDESGEDDVDGGSSNSENTEFEDMADEGCAGCEALVAEVRSKAVSLVRHEIEARRKPGVTMIVDGLEKNRALDYILELVCTADLGIPPKMDYPADLGKFKAEIEEELSFNRILDLEPNLSLPLSWMWACSSHKTCIPPKDVALPTRIIDVGTTLDPILRLHITRCESGQYLALSHCWGTSPMVKTTSETLLPFQNHIDFHLLPKNFRDAITITRSLGFRYVWIDSLCIIQDSSEDWARESALMSTIYTCATLTIAAMSAASSADGLLRPRNTSYSLPLQPHHDIVLRQKLTPWMALHREPLMQRAWTLQEQHLSRRLLYFASEQLFWECDGAVFSESSRRPERVNSAGQKRRHAGLTAMAAELTSAQAVTSMGSDTSREEKYRAWYSLTRDYSRRALTYVEDKLPAISGIAGVVGNSGHLGVYMAGLWKGDLLRGLKWTIGYTGVGNDRRAPMRLRRNDKYTAPSWSWAAYEGPVSYHNTCEIENNDHDLKAWERISERGLDDTSSMPESLNSEWPNRYRTFLVDSQIILATEHIYGRVLPGCCVVLSGLTRDVFVSTSCSDDMILESREGIANQPFYLDAEVDAWGDEKTAQWSWRQPSDLAAHAQKYTVLQIAANTQSGGVFSLILSQVVGSGTFERVGYTNVGSGLPWDWQGKPSGWDVDNWTRRELKLV